MSLTAFLVYLWPEVFQGPSPIEWMIAGLKSSLFASLFLPLGLIYLKRDVNKHPKYRSNHFAYREFQKLGFRKFTIKWSLISYLTVLLFALGVPVLFSVLHGFESLNMEVISRYLPVLVFSPMIVAVGFTSFLAFILNTHIGSINSPNDRLKTNTSDEENRP
jgi:hypothetical protein